MRVRIGVGALGLGCVLFLLLGVIAVPIGTAAPTRVGAGAPAVYALSIDGQSVGTLKSVSGASALSPLSTAPTASAPKLKAAATKGGGEVTTLELGFGMGAAVYDWIGKAIQGQSAPRKAAVIQYDATLNAIGQRAYDAATISEVAFPACDATSNAPGFLTVKLQGSPGAEAALPKVAAATTKNAGWTASKFKLDIDGLDGSHVIKVDGLTFKQRTTGDVRSPGRVDTPVFKVTLPDDITAKAWRDWYQDFAVLGKNTAEFHKTGRLSFLAANGTELAALQLSGIGPQALKAVDPTANETARKLELQFYLESATLSVNGVK